MAGDGRRVIFAGDVRDAEQDGGEEGTGDRRRAADGDDDEEVDHELKRELRIEAEDRRAERAAEAGEARPESEGEGEDGGDVDAESPRDAGIVDGGAQARSEARLRQAELQGERQNGAEGDDEETVLVERDAAEIDVAVEGLRHVHDLRARAHEIIDARHRHEDQADGEHDLFEMRLVVEAHVERAFEEGAERGGDEKGDGQAPEEREAEALHHDNGDIAARHGEGAVREIDEVHEAERDRQAHRQHEQQHAVGNAVEEHCQHDKSPTAWRAKQRNPGADFGSGLLRRFRRNRAAVSPELPAMTARSLRWGEITSSRPWRP